VAGAFSWLLNDEFGSYKGEQKELKYVERKVQQVIYGALLASPYFVVF